MRRFLILPALVLCAPLRPAATAGTWVADLVAWEVADAASRPDLRRVLVSLARAEVDRLLAIHQFMTPEATLRFEQQALVHFRSLSRQAEEVDLAFAGAFREATAGRGEGNGSEGEHFSGWLLILRARLRQLSHDLRSGQFGPAPPWPGACS